MEGEEESHEARAFVTDWSGQFQHAATMVKPGKIFLRRMIDLASAVSQLHYTVRLTSDLEWWHLFLSSWNGISLLHSNGVLSPDIRMQLVNGDVEWCGLVSNPVAH